MLSLARDTAVEIADAAVAQAVEPGAFDLSVTSDVASLEVEWRAFERTALGHVFQTYDFVATWLAHVGAARGVEARIVVGRGPDGDILFLLPFGLRPWLGSCLLEWLGAEHADYHAGLYAPRFLAWMASVQGAGDAHVHASIALFRSDADVVHLERQPAEIGGFPNPFARYKSVPFSARSHRTSLGDDWDKYYRSKRNSSSRRHDRLKWEKLQSLGPVEVIDAATPAETGRILSALFSQKAKSLAARGVPNFLAFPGVRDFYEALARSPHPTGLAHVSAIACNGEIVAANWGLVRGNHYYYVLTSYADGEVSKSSPGRALMYHLMQWSIARGITLFDFTIGDEEFKTQWCEESATLYDSVAVLHSRGLAHATVLGAMKSAKRAIKANPRLRAVAERVRRRLISTRA